MPSVKRKPAAKRSPVRGKKSKSEGVDATNRDYSRYDQVDKDRG